MKLTENIERLFWDPVDPLLPSLMHLVPQRAALKAPPFFPGKPQDGHWLHGPSRMEKHQHYPLHKSHPSRRHA